MTFVIPPTMSSFSKQIWVVPTSESFQCFQWSPFLFSKNQVTPPPRQAINNDRSTDRSLRPGWICVGRARPRNIKWNARIACSRRSDCRGREKNSRRRKKNAGRLEGEMGREQQFVNNVYRHSLALASRLVPHPPSFSRCTIWLAPHWPPRSTIWTPGAG